MQVQFEGRVYEFPDDATDEEISFALGQPRQQKEAQDGGGVLDDVTRQLGLTGRMVYQAFTSPATTVLEAGSTAFNLASEKLGSDVRAPSFAQAEEEMLRQAGVPEPETMTERAVQAGGQAMLGTAGLSKAAPGLMKATGEELKRQVVSSGAAGLAAQPAAEITKEFTGSDLAALIASVGVGVAVGGNTGKAMNMLKKGDVKLQTVDDIKKRAARSYTELDNMGVKFKPKSLVDLRDSLRKELKEERMVEGTPEADAINTRLRDMEIILKSNTPIDFNVLAKIRSTFNDLRVASDPNTRRLGSVAVAKIDNFISNLSPKEVIAGKDGIDEAVKKLVSARKDWRNAAKATMLEDVLDVAEIKKLNPSASESELIRKGFINIAADKNKLKQFSQDEQNIIKSVANGGSLDSLLSMAAKFNPARSQLVAGGLGYGAVTNPQYAIPIGVGGYAADVAQGVLRKQAADKAVRTIASGAAQPQPQDLRGLGGFAGGMFTDIPQ